MKCEHVTQILNVTTSERRGRWTTWRIQRHIARCPECRAAAQWLGDLERTVQVWRADPPPTTLRDRIAAKLPVDVGPPVSQWRPTVPIRLAAAFATVLVFGVALFVGRGNPAKAAIRQMQSAVSRVRNVHVTTWTTEVPASDDAVSHRSNSLQKVEELWYEAGRWRKDGVWGSRLIVANSHGSATGPMATVGTYYRYDSQAKTVVALQETGQQWSEFTVASFTGMDTTVEPDQMQMNEAVSANGKPAYNIVVSKRGNADQSRYLCLVEKSTDLPIQIDVQNYSNGLWHTTVRYDFEFNDNLPGSLFDPKTLRHESWSLQHHKS